ncbi:MAG: UDP-3-O-(3-hydroxymyristoyl)glucosamine N-acyltransferase [Bacteroidales bacterium]|nr:UDP-3-O-(3-hydroxymyristoyl)glucosamine N-acyltransferase [Bacteroidales bacterium]
MKLTARKIAEALNGTVEGNAEIVVSSLSKIEEGKPGTLSFLANPKYTSHIYHTQASIVIVNKDFVATEKINATLIRVGDPYSAFADLLEMYQQSKGKPSGISVKAAIDPTAVVGKDVYIGDFVSVGEYAVIGDGCFLYPNTAVGRHCKVGENTTLYAGVKVYDDCIIGNKCTLHAGVVIGADGFGFAPQQNKNYRKVPQIGNVVIEDNVEIGANTCIDRATLGSTRIRKGAIIDNLVQIAHNVEIGENTAVAAQTGISGSTRIGSHCVLAGQTGFAGHLNIADGTIVTAQSGVGRNIKTENTVYEGSPAFKHKDFQKSYIHFRRLNDLVNRVNELENKLKKLTTQ